MFSTTMRLNKPERCKSQSIDVRLFLANQSRNVLIISVVTMGSAQDIDGTAITLLNINSMMTSMVGSRMLQQTDAVGLNVIAMINVVLNTQANLCVRMPLVAPNLAIFLMFISSTKTQVNQN